MNTQLLLAFVTTCQCGSISAAARRLGKHQSQVSQWIADLEVDLGIALFTRSGNRSHLTEAGQALLPTAQRILQQTELLICHADGLRKGEPDRVLIGLENYLPHPPLTKAIADLLNDSTLNVEVVQDSRQSLIAQLENRELDVLLISEGDQLHYPQYHYCRIGHYEEVLTIAAHHPLAGKGRSLSLDDLYDHRELIWSRDEQETSQPALTESYACFSELTMMLDQLLLGNGFAYLPLAIAKPLADKGQLILPVLQFEQSPILRRVELLWHADFTLSKQGNRVISRLMDMSLD